MASSFVKRYIKPGELTRITLPSTSEMVEFGLDGRTCEIILNPMPGTVLIWNGQKHICSGASEAGIHQDSTGQWFGYLSEDEI